MDEDNSNMKQDIIDAVKDELETAIIVVIDDDDVDEENQKFPKHHIGKPLQLKEVIDLFDYDFDSGFGGQSCHNFYIYTKKRVFFIWEYDGSTNITSIPRNPEYA